MCSAALLVVFDPGLVAVWRKPGRRRRNEVGVSAVMMAAAMAPDERVKISGVGAMIVEYISGVLGDGI